MSVFRDSRFWIRTGDKAIISFANGALAVLTAGAVGIFEISVLEIFSVGGLSAAISIATSFSTAASGIEDPSQRFITEMTENDGKHVSNYENRETGSHAEQNPPAIYRGKHAR